MIGSTRRKVNFGWWLEILAPLYIGFSVLAASSLLYLKTRLWFADQLVPTILIAAGVLALLPVIALLIASRRFISRRQAAVQLESEMRMNNALTAAEAEIAPWPEPPLKPRVRDGFDWNWPRLTIPPVVALILVLAAILIPIKPVTAVSAVPNEPLAWEEMEDWLKTLEEEQVVEEEQARELLKQVESLRRQPSEEWFSHGSLEATDTLRQSLQRSISGLGRDLSKADRTLSALEKYSSAMSEAAREQLLEEYGDALEGLSMNKMALNEELMKQLQQMDPKQMQQMTPEQRQQLQQAMQKNMQALQKAMGQGAGEGEGEGEGEGQGWGEGEDADELMKLLLGEGMQPGQGGVSRGRGDAPMFHKDEESDLGTKNLEGVSSEDYSRAAPGEVLGLGIAEQDIDKTKPAPTTGAGAVGSMGAGGERIWQENLLPSEREALRRYFK